MQYDYSFSVWPLETHGFPPAMFTLFEMLKGRVEMTLTHDDFHKFVRDLRSYGFTLHEVTRVPHVEPEPVYV